jgi:hypothetical protein
MNARKVSFVLAVTTLFAARAAYLIFDRREVLYPDTFLFASGRAAWSSPCGAFAGFLFGMPGLRVFGLLGTTALALCFAWHVYGTKRRNLRVMALYVLPPGWYTMQAAADAGGAAASLAATKTRQGYAQAALLALTALIHLEAALVLLCVLVARRLGFRRDGRVALAAGTLACLAQWHVQVRYLLPGLAIVLTEDHASWHQLHNRNPRRWQELVRRSTRSASALVRSSLR